MQLLSKEQSKIATYNECEGALLLEAAAGSGKTRILTERVRYLLTKKEDSYFSVLCLTFTNKAADEMKERLKNVPNIEKRAFIGTFHEFCLGQIVVKQKKELGFSGVPHIFDENDKLKVLENIFLTNDIFSTDYKGLHPNEQRRRLKGFIDVISEAKRNLIVDVSSNNRWTDKRRKLYEEYNDRMLNQGAMDYDDIILYAFRILTERPQVANLYRRRYKYILVDEAQDLNYSQYQTLKALAGSTHKNIMMVGDPNQAIYAFNGASVKYMQSEFLEDFSASRLSITKNYRSSDEVLKLANHIKNISSTGDNYFSGKCTIKAFENEESESNFIIEEIIWWLSNPIYTEKEVIMPIRLQDIVIIARNRFVFKVLQQKLNSNEILKDRYYVRQGASSYAFESKYMNIFDLGLRIIVNPLDVVHYRQLCKETDIKFAKEGDRLDFLKSIHSKCLNKDYDLGALRQIVAGWVALIETPDKLHLVLKSMTDSFIGSNLSGPEQLKIDYDINEISNKWKQFQRSTHPAQHNISNFRYFLALNSSSDEGGELTISTIHAAKGLEFEIVFVMGMNDDILPSYRAIKNGNIDEERNTAYVAVTRAKKCVYLTYPQQRQMPWGDYKRQSISRFIKDYY